MRKSKSKTKKALVQVLKNVVQAKHTTQLDSVTKYAREIELNQTSNAGGTSPTDTVSQARKL